MFIEKKWLRVLPRPLTADGTALGVVTVGSVCEFYVKQHIALKGTALPILKVRIHRVLSDTQLLVGPVDGKITDYTNVSLYTLAAASTIEAEEQDRAGIPAADRDRAVYAEEPIVATRNVLVDCEGDYYGPKNPMPVQLSNGSVNIGTVNAELEVQLSHKDGDQHTGDVHDSVRVGDGVDEMAVNTDGSINVNIVNGASGPPEEIRFKFSVALAVPSGSETSIVTYTVPAGKTSRLNRVTFSGENVATYNLYVSGVLQERSRTHFGADLGGTMEFFGSNKEGPLYVTGTIIDLKVLHTRPMIGSFNGRIQVLEIN